MDLADVCRSLCVSKENTEVKLSCAPVSYRVIKNLELIIKLPKKGKLSTDGLRIIPLAE